MLSEFIIKNYGKDAETRAFLPILKVVAASYVGNSAMKYVQYCEDMLNINIMDVLNDFDRVKEDLKKYNRDKNSELIQSLKELDLNKLSDKQVANSAKFLKTVGDDELTAYLLFILDNNLDVNKPKIKSFMMEFETVLRTIKKINKPGGK
jgi:NADH:ubiquinone oxidoreductase subunit E